MSEPPASALPVARVAVDVSLAHLDRPFDYLVPEAMSEAAQPGCRVRVRFAGKDVAGFVLERLAASDHAGRLSPLRRLVSSERVLTAPVERLSRAVATHYAGSRADVLRLAVPPRHARVEKESPGDQLPQPVHMPAPAGWLHYAGGSAFLSRIGRASTPRAVWTAMPGEDWAGLLATAAATTLAADRGSLLCLPDRRDVQRVLTAVGALVPADHVVELTADLGPAPRYRAFLRVLRGQAQVVVGTRASVFAPVRDLGLLAIWDDGDDSHAEPRAPYPHAREVLALRARAARCAFVVGGFARTAEAQLLVESGWAQPLEAARPLLRARSPRVLVVGGEPAELARDPAGRGARLPRRAFDGVRAALVAGPVLVQVPRSGYLPGLACARCLRPGCCAICTGPLGISRPGTSPICRWCGRPAGPWRCPHCGSEQLRAPVVGSRRTAEELGRAFPGTAVHRSSGDHVLDSVSAEPALVVATPGAEPLAPGGYAAALIMDTWLTLGRSDLRTAEEAVRRWFNAAALVRSGADPGEVYVVGDPALPPMQALVRWDPAGFAARELAERASARLPPAVRLASVTGSPDAVGHFVDGLTLPSAAEVLGPVPVAAPAAPDGAVTESDELVRAVLRSPRQQGARFLEALRQALAVRSAGKLSPVRVHVDPQELG